MNIRLAMQAVPSCLGPPKLIPGGSSGRDIFSRHFLFIFVLGESVLDQVPDRHQADEPLMADDREMAKPSIGHFFHRHMNALVLTRRDHHGGHTL